jgi:hypothetical protein
MGYVKKMTHGNNVSNSPLCINDSHAPMFAFKKFKMD